MHDDRPLDVRARPGLRRRALSADSIAVFDPRSWRTHLVGSAAALLLTLFTERGAQPLASLADALGLAEAGFDADEAKGLIDKALSELRGCDLIEYVGAARAP